MRARVCMYVLCTCVHVRTCVCVPCTFSSLCKSLGGGVAVGGPGRYRLHISREQGLAGVTMGSHLLELKAENRPEGV